MNKQIKIKEREKEMAANKIATVELKIKIKKLYRETIEYYQIKLFFDYLMHK